MIRKEQLLERIDKREYFAQLFPQVRCDRNEFTLCSPFRDEIHPSFSLNISKGLWCDHGNGDSGDIFEFEQRWSRCDFPTALENLTRFADITIGPQMIQKAKRVDGKTETFKASQTFGNRADVDSWNANLFSKNAKTVKTYLNSRGLTDETLKIYSIGYDENLGAITIPFLFDDNQIVSLKRMFFDGRGWKMNNGKKDFRNYGPSTLYCAELVKNVGSVIICEGEFDCLILRQNGFKAVTGTSGAGTWKSSWSELLRGKNVVLIFDSDDAGRKSVLKVAKKLDGIARTVRLADLFPENDGNDKDQKDVTDFFRLGRLVEDFRTILSLATDYKREITLSEEEIAQRFSHAKIADEVLEEHDLIFVGGSFYTYGTGIWRKDGRRFVEREIKKRCGTKATRSLIESIKYLVSLECQVEEADLNADRMLFNFRNGMLNLRTDILEPHSRDQLSTIQFPFDFRPDAPCSRWRRFLNEVFQGNELLGLLLQEIFGYVLIPDTSMQRMFWFVGEGANGKGIAIKILEGLIDKNNRTCLDIRNLQNPFVRAAMYNKLLAVQGDFPKRFYGNEDLIKTIVGGDTLDAQEKFKPQFEFIPFCRFIFAMNTLPETKDLSKGFFRRVVIVPFTKTFSEDEQDRHLSETLQTELSGIFLWALEGLKRLVKNNCFTESPDALSALENYKQEHNTVGQFVESECVFQTESKCKGSDLWTAYEIYCAESGVDALLRKEFVLQLKKNHPVTVKTHRWENDDAPSRTYFGIGLREK